MTRYDFSHQNTAELIRKYQFHDRDLTETMEEECRRMYLLQEIGAELRRRGVLEPWSKRNA